MYILRKIREGIKDNTLDLRFFRLTDEDVKVVCDFLNQHPEITELNVADTQISDLSAVALAENNTLISLNLSRNEIGPMGAAALAANKTLRQLDLSFNKIGDAGAKTFAANTTLESLKLRKNKITAVGAGAFGDNATLNLLDLSFNKICDDEEFIPLTKNKKITSLNLSGNKIGDKLAVALASNEKLTYLDLKYNLITNLGIHAFINNKKLTFLRINGYISAENTQAIKLMLKQNQYTQARNAYTILTNSYDDQNSFFNRNKVPKEVIELIADNIKATSV